MGLLLNKRLFAMPPRSFLRCETVPRGAGRYKALSLISFRNVESLEDKSIRGPDLLEGTKEGEDSVSVIYEAGT
jgi:hypothetical protein